MPDYTFRNTKGSALTFNEADNNFTASRAASRLATASLLAPASGAHISQQMCGSSTSSTATAVTDSIVLSPFQIAFDLTIDQVAIRQQAASPTHTADFRILVYTADANGRPDSRDAETATVTSVQGSNTASLSHTFNANTLYWVGIHYGTVTSSPNFDGCAIEALLPLGLGTGLNTSAINCSISLGSTSLGSAPATWTFAASQVGVGVPATIGFRAA